MGPVAAVEKDNLYIPLINFEPFLSGTPSERNKVAAAVISGFRNAGFIYLTHHGIPPSVIASAFAHSVRFFAQDQADKDALAWYSARANRGYVIHGREKNSMPDEAGHKVAKLRASAPDLKESLEIGRENEPDCPNMWPQRKGSNNNEWTDDFKRDMIAFHTRCSQFHIQVMRAIAIGLGIEAKWFDGFTSQADNTLRLLHYPPVKRKVFQKNANQVRAGAHTDYGSVTLLFQDSRGGLQIESPNGNFVDAIPIADAIVVNAGDLLARWSNDTIKSTKHRVVEPPIRRDDYPARYSIAYFCNPNFDRDIEAIPGTYGDGEPKYPKMNSGEYLMKRLSETY